MCDLQDDDQHLLDELVDFGAERGVQVAAFADGLLLGEAGSWQADPARDRYDGWLDSPSP